MITAQELRLGNWLSWNGKYFPVSYIGETIGIDTSKYAGDGATQKFQADPIFSQDSKDLHPIPLEPSILEKAGFDLAPQRISIYLRGRLQLWMGHNGCISYLRNEDKAEVYWIGDCKHLHQLQNLYFALCGEELEITL